MLHQGGGALENFLFPLLRGSNIALERGTVFWRVSLWESTPFLLPLPTYAKHVSFVAREIV